MTRYVLLFFMASLVQGATVIGTITDSSGGALAGSMVTIRNAATGVERGTRTNEAGSYELDGLQAGSYDITASLAKFTSRERKELQLRVGNHLRVNRLNVIGDPLKNIPAGYAYNPAAFQEPAPGTFGVSGRNIVRGSAYRSVDLSLFRNVRLGERARLRLRFEANNALNQVNFQGPVTNQASSPGLFISAAPPRQVQLGAKVTF